jgi:N-acetyllactosaminide 3-alpha-galactosyltransferase
MRNHKDSNQKAWIVLILGGCLAGLSLFLSLWKKKSCSSDFFGKEKKLYLENTKASIFQNKKRGNQSSEYRNPFEGKKVIFVENPMEEENADGVRGHLEAVGDSDYIPSFYTRVIKRGGDTILSALALVILSPVFLFLSVAIFLDDPGPIFFIQKRLGKNKRYFPLHKFRSMKMCTPHDTPTHMLENPEQYITRMGKFLRAHSLDELPQIWDIFVGNMSLIGPRPGLWNQDLLTAERDKYNANDIQPGLSGWAQINGRDSIEIPDKAKLDGEYVEKIGFLMDLRCFFGTIFSVLRKDGVVEGGTGALQNAPSQNLMKSDSSLKREFTKGKNSKELNGSIGFGERAEVENKLKVLITGAESYIGTSFETYVDKHYRESFLIDTLDMRDNTWKNLDFSKYDIVFHVAGLAHADVGRVTEETKAKYYAVNTDLAIETAKKAKEDGVKQFIFMSSSIIYGDSAPLGKRKRITRNTQPSPANFYGDSKWQADKAIRELDTEDFFVVVLRPPMIYGKGCKGNYPVLAKLAKTLPVFPDIKNERSMLYIDNLSAFLCQIMLRKERGIFWPQNAEYSNTSELVKWIAEANNHRILISKFWNIGIKLAGKLPGKFQGLMNKAFGNMTYDKEMSDYDFDYQLVDVRTSIKKVEGDEFK